VESAILTVRAVVVFSAAGFAAWLSRLAAKRMGMRMRMASRIAKRHAHRSRYRRGYFAVCYDDRRAHGGVVAMQLEYLKLESPESLLQQRVLQVNLTVERD